MGNQKSKGGIGGHVGGPGAGGTGGGAPHAEGKFGEPGRDSSALLGGAGASTGKPAVPTSGSGAPGAGPVSGGAGASGSGGLGGGSAPAAGGAGASSAVSPKPLPARKACLDDFILMKTVGKGSFGKVVMVRKKDDGRVYAMKILKKEMVLKRKQYEHTLAERRILENIDHPFIVSLRFAFQTEHKLYMVFDFFNGGELYHYLSEGGRFAEERARFYAAEITSALAYLHKNGIVYRDLKPENLILDSAGHIRITDFGLSKEGVAGDTITSICGTPEYLAPEILRKRPYGVAVDWWSLGTLLFEMIAGLPPFYDRNRQVMYRKILEAPLDPPPFMSPEAADLCAKLLVREPTARLGYHGGDEVKAHPFFRGLNWDALDALELSPPWKPVVADASDVRNIASEFVNEPAGVTPSPAGSKLRDMTGATPPSFTDFTFTHNNVLDGQTYRVSFSGGEDDEDLEGLARELPPGSGGAGGKAAAAGSGSGSDAADTSLVRGSDGEGEIDTSGVMGGMEGLRIGGGPAAGGGGGGIGSALGKR